VPEKDALCSEAAAYFFTLKHIARRSFLIIYMITTGIIAALIIVIYLFGRANLAMRFYRQVNALFAGSKYLMGQHYEHEQLHGLPGCVQGYFRQVLRPGQPYISYARLLHKGQFKTGLHSKWVSIHGEQYVATETPGFIWKGDTSMFTARDMYIQNKGRLIVTLFSIYNIEDATGGQYDEGELLRWLAESVLYPTNLLPSARLQWLAVSNLSAKIIFTYAPISAELLVTFNEKNEIIQMQAQRFMGKEKKETWVINLSNYKEINDVLIPTDFEVLWRLKEADFSYAKFTLQQLEYDLPDSFKRAK